MVAVYEFGTSRRGQRTALGALFVINGKIIAQDRNRQLRKGENLSIKSSFMLHAERAVVAKAIKKIGRKAIRGGVVYVAGFLVRDKRPLVRRGSQPKGSCTSCSVLYPEFDLSVAFPSEVGWVTVAGDKAYSLALKNKARIRALGINTTEYRKSISL